MTFGQVLVALIRGASGVVGYVASALFESGIYKAVGVEEEEEFIALVDHKHRQKMIEKKRKEEAK